MIRDGVAFVLGQGLLEAAPILRARRKAKATAYRSTSPRITAYENIAGLIPLALIAPEPRLFQRVPNEAAGELKNDTL